MVLLKFLLIVLINVALGTATVIEPNISSWDSHNVVNLEISDRQIDERAILDAQVVNGAPANPGDFPWHVLLYTRRRDDSWIFCAANLLSRNTVITDATCLNGGTEVRTLLGSTIFNRGVVIQGRRFILHPRFRPNNEFSIGMVQLIDNVNFSQSIRPILLVPQAFEAFAFENHIMRFAGFGSRTPSQPNNNLLWTILRILPLSICAELYPSSARNLFLCTENLGQAGAHPGYGDQGGGLIWRQNNLYHIVGIFSRVVNTRDLSYGPPGFINLGPHQRWITSLLSQA